MLAIAFLNEMFEDTLNFQQKPQTVMVLNILFLFFSFIFFTLKAYSTHVINVDVLNAVGHPCGTRNARNAFWTSEDLGNRLFRSAVG